MKSKRSDKNYTKKRNRYADKESSNNSEVLSFLCLPPNTLNLIESIENGSFLCYFCNLGILDYPIFTCENCYSIFHLDCVKSNLNEVKFSTVTKYSFDCPNCNHQKISDTLPDYNCYCGKYISSKKEEIEENLILHGCGQVCEKDICNHMKCSWPCHPGQHENCKLCIGDRNKSKINITNFKQTSIVNLKGKIKEVGPSCEYDLDIVYCGRAIYMGGWKLQASIWANPFKVRNSESNEVVCEKYENYLRSKDELLEKLPELIGKKLACWCFPKSCHTEVLLKLMKEKGLI
jgi:hypothetical protein